MPAGGWPTRERWVLMFVNSALIARRIAALRRIGVKVRDDWPPSNLDNGPAHLPGVNAEITTAEILAERNPSHLVSIPKQLPPGDIDVLLERGVRVGFQVKDLSLFSVDQAGRPNHLYIEALTAKDMLLSNARRHQRLGTYSRVRLARGPDKVARMTGSTELRSFRDLHHVDVRVPWEFYAHLTKEKIKDAVKKSVDQLERAGASIVVPVLGFLGSAIDEPWAFDFIKKGFATNNGFWSKADAVCLLLYERHPSSVVGIFTESPHLVPILNRHRPGFDPSWVTPKTQVRLHDGAEVSIAGNYGPDGSPKLSTIQYYGGVTRIDGFPLARVVDDPALTGMSFMGVPGPLRGPEPIFSVSTRRPSRRGSAP